MTRGARVKPAPCLLPLSTDSFPRLAPCPWPRVWPKGATSLEGEMLANASPLRTASSTKAPARPACRAAYGKGCVANSPAGGHLPPPESEPALGTTTARSAPKKWLLATGDQRGLGSLWSAHKGPRCPQICQGHTGLAPGSYRCTPSSLPTPPPHPHIRARRCRHRHGGSWREAHLGDFRGGRA